MSTNATAIRDAVFTRARNASTYETARKTDMPTLNGADCPALSVFLVRERMKPLGDGTSGAPQFLSTATIGIAVIRGFDDPVVTDGLIDTDVDTILDNLFTDISFVGAPPAGQDVFYWRAATRIDRQRIFVQQGETYFVETRVEIDFEFELYFGPTITAPLTEISIALAGEFVAPLLDYEEPEGSQYVPGLNQ